MTPLPQVSVATPADLPWITHLQRANSNRVGFLSTLSLRQYQQQSAILTARLDNRPIGYLIGPTALRWQPLLRPVTQIAVVTDSQGAGVGSLLLAHHIAAANTSHQAGVQAICRADLHANAFWESRNFVPICYLTPENARKKPLIVWRLPLIKKLPLWFASPPLRAGTHGTRPLPPHRKGTLNANHDPKRWQLPHPQPTQRRHRPRRSRPQEI